MIRSQSLLLLLLLTAASKRTPRRNHHRRHTLPNKSPPGITIHPSLEPTARAFIDDNGRTNGGGANNPFLELLLLRYLVAVLCCRFFVFSKLPNPTQGERTRYRLLGFKETETDTSVLFFFCRHYPTLPIHSLLSLRFGMYSYLQLLPCLCDFARFKCRYLGISGLGWEFETHSRDWRSGARVTQSRVVISLMYQGTRG
jgi:hypothetical protein